MSRFNLYLGRAGQLAVMSEFLTRGRNVAIPEVDIGDDIFVVRDSDGNLSGIQVRTGSAKEGKGTWHTRFSVSLSQLTTPISPELTYVFAIRRNQCWECYLVTDRTVLNDEYQIHGIGTQTGNDKLNLYVSFSDRKAVCSKRDFTSYLNNWGKWPQIFH